MAELALIATVASTALQAAGTLAAGSAAKKEAFFEAQQMQQQAGQERATSQRVAIEKRREAGIAGSRAQALAAAGGGSATDPTVVNIQSNIAGEGEYNALSALYTGEERARGLEEGADAKIYEGRTAKRASLMKAGATILGGASSLMGKYGGDGPPGGSSSAYNANYDSSQYGPYDLPWQRRYG